MEIVIPVTIVGLIVAAAIGYSIWTEKKRREGIQQLAGQLGIEYREELAPDDREVFAKFALASLGHNRVISNILVADSGEIRMVIFDYRYTVGYTNGSGKNKSTPKQTVVMAQSGELSVPTFQLSPESLFQKIAGLFGFPDINFEDDPSFSKAFKLSGPNAEQIRAFFTVLRRKELLSQRQVTLEGNRDHFLFYQARSQCSIEELKGLMGRAFSLYAVLRSEPDA